jgi:plastocyanin
MFVPDTATVNVGDVVQFIPTVDHTVLADDGSFFVGAGTVKCFMFTTANSYPFKCTFHPFMVGTLTVQ